MKKSMTFGIIIIFVASVMFITYFGLQADVYNEMIYVEEIIIQNEDKLEQDSGTYVELYLDMTLANTVTSQIDWRVMPNNASNKNVIFSYDEDNAGIVSVTDRGIATFNKVGTYTIGVVAKDRNIVRAEIRYVVLYKDIRLYDVDNYRSDEGCDKITVQHNPT